MSRCKKKRFLAFMLTVAMLLGVMPVDLLGGIASVKAAETVHEVNFKKLSVPEGEKTQSTTAVITPITYGDYFKASGKVYYYFDSKFTCSSTG